MIYRIYVRDFNKDYRKVGYAVTEEAVLDILSRYTNEESYLVIKHNIELDQDEVFTRGRFNHLVRRRK